ncbi:unnamed protein product, partial [Mesorhabditis belari]|uniref:Zinc metalloproteinase n=1 Tax=Mesorhabditis belari TaxID=2138241 RepID=A0AAF3FHU7_9BILA
MKAIYILLFLAVVGCVESRGFDWIKKLFPKHNWGRWNEEQIYRFKQSFGNKTNVDRFMLALDRANEAMKGVAQTAQEKAIITEKIKNFKPRARSPLPPNAEKDIQEINIAAGVAGSLYGGDMMLSDDQVDALLGEFLDDADDRVKRQAQHPIKLPGKLWTSGTFYYVFDANLPEKTKKFAQIGIDFWKSMTCINFVEDANAPNRVRFRKDTGCSSSVGMIGGEQIIKLADSCGNFRNCVHEIAHALGFFHEMSRYDVKDSVTVYKNNVNTSHVSNFNEQTNETNYNYGLPFEYGSIMQYKDTDFIWDYLEDTTTRTMYAKIDEYQYAMGSRQIAFYDISMMNEHYQCKQKCTSGANCVNGGFRNPRDCNTCICPSGWGGATCSIRPPGCGTELTATTTLQTQIQAVGASENGVGDFWETCNFLIRAPVGNKIELMITRMTNAQCSSGCEYMSLEAKVITDHRYTGIRFCCKEDVGEKVISEGHIMPVLLNNRYSLNNFTFTYRYACQQCARNLPEYNEEYPTTAWTHGTATFGYRNDVTQNNCLVADWFCQIPAPYTKAKFELYKGVNYTSKHYGYNENVNPAGFNDTTSQANYRPFVCNNNGQWSFDGEATFKYDCYANTIATTTTTKATTTPLPACQRCAYNVSSYKDNYDGWVWGTYSFRYR